MDLREGIEAELRYESHLHRGGKAVAKDELARLLREAREAGMAPTALALLTGLTVEEIEQLSAG